jgi:hypothetical protein
MVSPLIETLNNLIILRVTAEFVRIAYSFTLYREEMILTLLLLSNRL